MISLIVLFGALINPEILQRYVALFCYIWFQLLPYLNVLSGWFLAKIKCNVELESVFGRRVKNVWLDMKIWSCKCHFKIFSPASCCVDVAVFLPGEGDGGPLWGRLGPNSNRCVELKLISVSIPSTNLQRHQKCCLCVVDELV